jgi:hypothetical protein
MIPPASSRSGGAALDYLEEAVHLLRSAPLSCLVAYYIGSIPFVAGFLYFWADMSRSAFGNEHHAQAALGISLLYLWMKAWHTFSSGLLYQEVTGQAESSWTLSRWFRALTIQALIQPSGLFVLPVAFAITLPFGWVYAFYQNVTIYSSAPGTDLRSTFRRAAEQAELWPGQNHAILAILALFSFFVFLNVGIVLFQLPQLLRTLFGIETSLSQSGWSLLNTTFLMVSLGLTYLCVDPITKTVYVLRCFHGEAVRTGEDLKVAVRRIPGATQATAAILLALGLLAGASHAGAAAPNAGDHPVATRTTPAQLLPAAELDRAIGEVISRREYGWRLPRIKAEREDNPGLVTRFLDSLFGAIRGWAKAGMRVAREAVDWILEFLFKRLAPRREAAGSNAGWMNSLPLLVYLLLGASVCVLAILALRFWKRRAPPVEQATAQPVTPAPDLADQSVVADQLPEEEWLKLARELADQGELRLALRGFYLASLAHLGRRELLRIAKFKSNREYQTELCRRAPAQSSLHLAFSELVSTFDWAWYGLGEVDNAILASFCDKLERVTAC